MHATVLIIALIAIAIALTIYFVRRHLLVTKAKKGIQDFLKNPDLVKALPFADEIVKNCGSNDKYITGVATQLYLKGIRDAPTSSMSDADKLKYFDAMTDPLYMCTGKAGNWDPDAKAVVTAALKDSFKQLLADDKIKCIVDTLSEKYHLGQVLRFLYVLVACKVYMPASASQ